MSEVSVLGKVKKRYIQIVNYRIYRLANRSEKFDFTISYYIAEFMKKMMLQIKSLFFDPKNLFSIIGFLTAFKLDS